MRCSFFEIAFLAQKAQALRLGKLKLQLGLSLAALA